MRSQFSLRFRVLGLSSLFLKRSIFVSSDSYAYSIAVCAAGGERGETLRYSLAKFYPTYKDFSQVGDILTASARSSRNGKYDSFCVYALCIEIKISPRRCGNTRRDVWKSRNAIAKEIRSVSRCRSGDLVSSPLTRNFNFDVNIRPTYLPRLFSAFRRLRFPVIGMRKFRYSAIRRAHR